MYNPVVDNFEFVKKYFNFQWTTVQYFKGKTINEYIIPEDLVKYRFSKTKTMRKRGITVNNIDHISDEENERCNPVNHDPQCPESNKHGQNMKFAQIHKA